MKPTALIDRLAHKWIQTDALEQELLEESYRKTGYLGHSKPLLVLKLVEEPKQLYPFLTCFSRHIYYSMLDIEHVDVKQVEALVQNDFFK